MKGPRCVDAEPFRSWAREAWRDYTLGEMSTMTGLQPVTLRNVMWGDSKRMRIRTAAAIFAMRLAIIQQRDVEA